MGPGRCEIADVRETLRIFRRMVESVSSDQSFVSLGCFDFAAES